MKISDTVFTILVVVFTYGMCFVMSLFFLWVLYFLFGVSFAPLVVASSWFALLLTVIAVFIMCIDVEEGV